MSSPFTIRKSTGVSLLIILLLSIGALGLVDVSPTKIILIYPWGWELVLPSEWAIVVTFLKGGVLGVFLLAFFRKVSEKISANKEDSPQKLAWKMEDALTNIQKLQDENMQLKAFNDTLRQAVATQQNAPVVGPSLDE
jgi:cell division protein FtsB